PQFGVAGTGLLQERATHCGRFLLKRFHEDRFFVHRRTLGLALGASIYSSAICAKMTAPRAPTPGNFGARGKSLNQKWGEAPWGSCLYPFWVPALSLLF